MNNILAAYNFGCRSNNIVYGLFIIYDSIRAAYIVNFSLTAAKQCGCIGYSTNCGFKRLSDFGIKATHGSGDGCLVRNNVCGCTALENASVYNCLFLCFNLI